MIMFFKKSPQHSWAEAKPDLLFSLSVATKMNPDTQQELYSWVNISPQCYTFLLEKSTEKQKPTTSTATHE